MPGILQDKVLVVVGGTTGLGLSAATAFVAEGAHLVVLSRSAENVEKAVAALGANARGLVADAAEPESAAKAIAEAQSSFGAFHGLYHIAGGSGRRKGDGPLHELTDEGIDYTLGLNLKSVLQSNRAALRAFLEQGRGGTILNMTSVLAWSPAPRHFATHAYAAAKAGIIGLTKSAAAYYAPHNIRVNAIAPALVDTPMAQRAVANEEILRYIATKQPLDGGRVGLPGDYDAAAVWFMSDQSRFATGQVLGIDGGWSVSEGQLE